MNYQVLELKWNVVAPNVMHIFIFNAIYGAALTKCHTFNLLVHLASENWLSLKR